MSLGLRVNALKESIGEKIQCVGSLSTGTSAIEVADGLIEKIGVIAQLGVVSENLGREVELAFLEYLRDVMEANEGSSLPPPSIKSLLQLSLAFSSARRSASKVGIPEGTSTRVPFMVLWTVLEGHTIGACRIVWSWFERFTKSEGTDGAVYKMAKIKILELCNALLRRLSLVQNTEFAGQIRLFLSRAFDLTERSAMNVGGKKNLENRTDFQDEEEFMNELELKTTSGILPAGSSSESDVQRLPMTEEREEGLVADDAAETSQEEAAPGPVQHQQSPDEFPVDYSLYRAFWGMQKKIQEPEWCLSTPEMWKNFVTNTDKVLSAFEGNDFSEHDILLAREHWGAIKDERGQKNNNIMSKASEKEEDQQQLSLKSMEIDENEAQPGPDDMSSCLSLSEGKRRRGGDFQQHDGVFFVCKYLTNSRLLRLQLRDPTLRLQLLAQLMSMSCVISKELHKEKKPPADDGGNAAKEALDRKQTLSQLVGRMKRLIQRTPPRGKEFLALEVKTLQRNASWVSWKVGGCKASLEKKPCDPFPPRDNKSLYKIYPDAKRARVFGNVDSKESLDSICRSLHDRVPSSSAHLQFLYDCLEPDSGVEEEYHPKNDQLYCWRAVQLIAKDNLAMLDFMGKGDLEHCVAEIRKNEKGVTSGEGKGKCGKNVPSPPLMENDKGISSTSSIKEEDQMEVVDNGSSSNEIKKGEETAAVVEESKK